MKSILDPTFRYVASHATDLRKTFARIRREERERQAPVTPDRPGKVVRLRSDGKRVA